MSVSGMPMYGSQNLQGGDIYGSGPIASPATGTRYAAEWSEGVNYGTVQEMAPAVYGQEMGQVYGTIQSPGMTYYGMEPMQQVITGTVTQPIMQEQIPIVQALQPMVQAQPMMQPIVQAQTMIQTQPIMQTVTQTVPEVQYVPMQIQSYEVREVPITAPVQKYVPPPSPPPPVVRSPPPPPVRALPEPEPEPEPVRKPKKEAPVAVRATAPPPAPEPQEPFEYTDYKLVENMEEIPYDNYQYTDHPLYVDRVQTRDVEVPVDKIVIQEVPYTIEKITYQEVKVPFDVPVETINFVDQVKEVPVERLVVQNVEVPIERVVIQEVQVPYDKIVEKVIVQEVPVERIVVKDVPVTVEKIVIKDVPVPVEKIVERIVEKPVEKIVYQDRIVYQDKIVYQDRVVEVPVERVVYKPPPREGPIVRDQNATMVTQGMYASQRMVTVGGSKKIGVGVKLRRNAQGQTSVQELLHGFGAQKSGQVAVDDVILAIDGQSVDGWDLDSIKSLTIGQEGSTVTLTLQRAGQTFQVSLPRIFPAGYDATNVEAMSALASVSAPVPMPAY